MNSITLPKMRKEVNQRRIVGLCLCFWLSTLGVMSLTSFTCGGSERSPASSDTSLNSATGSGSKVSSLRGVFLNTNKNGFEKLDFKNDHLVIVYIDGVAYPSEYRREGDFIFMKEPILGTGIERQITLESPTRILGGPSMDGSDPDVWVKNQ
jgi:hypothetical protein